MPTQLERALAVVDAFVPQDKPGTHYVYAYLGKASYDATQYELIDGLCLSSKRIWHLDESQTECVAYIGEGVADRIGVQRKHPFVPINIQCRVKLYEGASKADAQELERLLIAELGCILDDDVPDGCLANVLYFCGGPYCCKSLEARYYKLQSALTKATAAAAISNSVNIYAMTVDKSILAQGSAVDLSRQFDVDQSRISACCKGKQSGIWSRSLKDVIYFCYVDEFVSCKVMPMSTSQFLRNRIMIAAKLDGSDICCGTASEIRRYAPEINHRGALHRVAQGKASYTNGWTARYVDEPEAPVATCGPNLSAFF